MKHVQNSDELDEPYSKRLRLDDALTGPPSILPLLLSPIPPSHLPLLHPTGIIATADSATPATHTAFASTVVNQPVHPFFTRHVGPKPQPLGTVSSPLCTNLFMADLYSRTLAKASSVTPHEQARGSDPDDHLGKLAEGIHFARPVVRQHVSESRSREPCGRWHAGRCR
jgi:hypothetical protein